jgi:hypothetical protein
MTEFCADSKQPSLEEERNAANAFRAWVEEEALPVVEENDGDVSSQPTSD